MITALNHYVILEPISEEESVSSTGIVFSQEAVPAKKAVKAGKVLSGDDFSDEELGSRVFYLEDKSFKMFVNGTEMVVVDYSDLVARESK